MHEVVRWNLMEAKGIGFVVSGRVGESHCYTCVVLFLN